MRKLVLGLVGSVLVLSNVGCILPIYSPDRTRRMSELLITSENLRMVTDEWERAWHLDQPMHTTPFRTHGGM